MDEGNEFQGTTLAHQSVVTRLNQENYDDSTELKRSRLISEIYNETEEMEASEELHLMGVDEPVNFKQAVED